MGYSLSWAAIKNAAPEAVHSLLRLSATHAWEEIPESEIVGASLPTGWYLVLFNQKEMDDNDLEKLSSLGDVVYCLVEDHVMFSRASGWKRGKLQWSVTHDCEEGRYHLEVEGTAPSSLQSIRAEVIAKQDVAGGENANVDHVYDAPAQLAKSLTGFRHDEDISGTKEHPFQVLQKKGFFGRFLGGKN
jgi:hypothetical protein